MIPDNLSVLAAFVAVAEERSFTKAAVRLGVSTSALSHAIRGLEESLGVRLLARTTRSVAPTEAGDQLLAQVGPAMGDIRTALDGIGRLRERPAGRLRLIMPRIAASMVLLPRLARSPASTRTSSSTSPPTTARSTSSPRGSTPGSRSASSSSAT
jgi:DNA-binding transcriptional LysR family regulator